MFYDHLKFYGAAQSPLQSSPDPGAILPVDSCTDLLTAIISELENGNPVIGMRGAHGAGKTFLAGRLAAELDTPEFQSVRADGHGTSPADIQRLLADAAGLREAKADPALLLGALQAEYRTRRLVLIIDDAESLDAAVFLYCWQMISLCRMKAVRLHLVLIGKLGAWPGLNGPALAGMRRASISDLMIRGLNPDEAAAYLERKFREAGVSMAGAMSRRAAAGLIEHSRGIPGRLNDLAEAALNYAIGKRARRISVRMLRDARLIDTPPATPALDYLRPLLSEASVGGVATILAAAAIFTIVSSTLPAPRAGTPAALPLPPTAAAGENPPPQASTWQAASADLAKPAQPASSMTATGGAQDLPPMPIPPAARPRGHGLVLVAMAGDTMDNLYQRVYRGLEPPPFTEVVAANQLPIRQGSLVVFPEPPHGWSAP